MQDSKLRSLSLLSWTLEIWAEHRRGLPQSGQIAAITHCMEHHQEWWDDWETAKMLGEDPSLLQKGFTEFESIHTLALAFVEENAYSRESGNPFSHERYLETANRYVKEALSRPNLKRLAKSKVY